MTTTLKENDAVWYYELNSDKPKAAVIVDVGEKDGQLVYDCEIVGETDRFERNRWGYPDQFKAR